MIKTLIKKEIIEIVKSAKFTSSFIVTSLLIIITFYVGARNYQISQSQYEAAVAENIRAMEGLEDWRSIQHKIMLPPQPIASFVMGISNDIGRNISIAGRGELNPVDSRYSEDPIYAVFRFLDLDFLFQIILALFAILLTYNSISGEKENGTLRLVFSNSIPRDKYIIAKIGGAFISLFVPLLIPILIGSLFIPVLGIPFTSGDWIKLIFMILTGFLYFGAFLTISIFISTITKKSSDSFLILLLVWILSVLILPRASVILAGRFVDVPSLDEINSKKNQYSRQLNEEHFNKLSEFRSEAGADVFGEFQKFMEKLNEDRDSKMNEFAEKLNEERRNKEAVRQDLGLNISRISPSSVLSLTLSSLAGTSLKLNREYQEQAKNYQKIFADFQKEKTGTTSGSGMMFIVRNDGDDVKKINPDELPKFVFKYPEFKEAISNSLLDIALLILFNILFFVLSFTAFLKYDLR